MYSIGSLKIRTRIILIVFILMFGLFLSGLVTYVTVDKVRIKGVNYTKIIDAKDLIADILPPPGYIVESYLLAFQEYIADDKSELDSLIKKSLVLQEKYNQTQEKWEDMLEDPKLREEFLNEANKPAEEFFRIWKNDYIPKIEAGDKEGAYAILAGPLNDSYQAHRIAIDKVVKRANEKYVKVENDVTSVFNTARFIGFSTWFLTFVIGGFLTWLISKSLGDQLIKMSQELDSIAQEIQSSTDQQGDATIQQSSSVNETTATMDELNASFSHTQVIAQESSNRAKNALKVSDDGNVIIKNMVNDLSVHREKVAQIVEHISRLSQLTRQIHNIASLTSNLTNQTNILALNAAVQAAHVKQYGEGFSVIAGEIRKLADESKKFLSHIDVLSENIQQATDATIKIVEEGNKTIQDIIELGHESSKSFDSIIEITNSSFEGAEQTSLNIQQQGTAVHQVLSAMEDLNQSSQQTMQGMTQIRHQCDRLSSITYSFREDI